MLPNCLLSTVIVENVFIGSIEYCHHVEYTLSDLIMNRVMNERICQIMEL